MRMIAIVDRDLNAEIPLKGIEEIPEGIDPNDIFEECFDDYDEEGKLGFVFIHPLFGALIQASDMDAVGSDHATYVKNRYMYELCMMIEVEPEFETTQEDLRPTFLQLKNRWVAMAKK